MTATALIAEDEPLLARALQAELAQLWPELRIVASVGDGAQAVQQALARRPSICFFDIRMPGLSGLEAAQALAEDWPDEPGADAAQFPLLVFITAYDQYAVQAFEAQAVDYLLKPVQRERLAQLSDPHTPTQLSRSVEQLRELLGSAGLAAAAPAHTTSPVPKLDVLQTGVGATVRMVPIDDVVFFEAADKYLRVITAKHEHLVRIALRELLPQLDAQRFWQVNRGLVVQARCIESATREDTGRVTLTLRGRGEKLSVSRLYAHLFKAM